MPNTTNNIWVDSTFIQGDSTQVDSRVAVVFSESDVVGGYSFPVVYKVANSENTLMDVALGLVIPEYQIDVSDNIPGTYTAISGIDFISLVDISNIYDSGSTTISGFNNFKVMYLTGYNKVITTWDDKVSMIIGNKVSDSKNFFVSSALAQEKNKDRDFVTNYINFSGNYDDDYGLPIGTLPMALSKDAYYRTGNSDLTLSMEDTPAAITFTGWVTFPYIMDLFSTTSKLDSVLPTELHMVPGKVKPIDYELFSSTQEMDGLNTELYASTLKVDYINSEISNEDGRLYELNAELYSTNNNYNFLDLDIGLYSLQIKNFSIALDEYSKVSAGILVDVVDDIYLVSLSGTKVFLGAHQINVTYLTIDNGYRLYYDDIDTFLSLQGPTEFKVHAENMHGNVLEESFYITSGYLVEYENHLSFGLDLGFDQEVLVRVEAEDLSSCPSSESLAWSFRSSGLRPKELGASICGISNTKDVPSDLSAKIKPISSAYYYGKLFELVLTAKDFAGNEMTPITINYKVENKPE